ncbi:MAG TPA: anthranilate synthase component I, partial [Candidatus Thioglobus sp.]|nr:anthranilate synthase component I [Candidatus Thioglobus sp.]
MNKASFEQYVSDGYNHVPVYKAVALDTDTALGLYLKLANNSYSYLFESVQGGEKWGRYSMIGLHAQTVIKVFDYEVRIEQDGKLLESTKVKDPLVWIEQYLSQYKVPQLDALPDFNGGLVGY